MSKVRDMISRFFTPPPRREKSIDAVIEKAEKYDSELERRLKALTEQAEVYLGSRTMEGS